MAVIDAHAHLYPPDVGAGPAAWAAAHGEPHWSALCTRSRPSGPVQLFPTVAELLRDMDAAGVDRTVLLGWYWERPGTCAMQNRFYAACVRAHPDRLAAFAAVQPAAGPAALAEMRRARDDGLIGLGELSPHAQGVAAGDAGWDAVLRLAGEFRWPVNLHVTDPDAPAYPGRVDTPRSDFDRWAREFPQTTFILAHWGGGTAFDRNAPRAPNVFFDAAASPLQYGPEAWSRATAGAGSARLLFGSDNPLRLYPRREAGVGLAALVREAVTALAPADRAAVMGGNAARLLGG